VETVMAMHGTAFVILLASAAAMGGFLFGFDTAVINGAVEALRAHFQVGPWTIGQSVSLALLGSAAGALAAGPLADRIGRRPVMLAAAVLFAVSSLGSGLPFTVWDFIVWRMLGGIAVGAASVVAPAYIAEVAPARLRGRLGSLQQLAIVSGIFAALLVNWALTRAAGSASEPILGAAAWRWMFWSELLPSILYGIGAWLVPESPRYLVARGRDAEALAVLRRIEPATADAELAGIRTSLASWVPPRLRDLRAPGTWLMPVVWIGIALSLLQQLSGINVIFYYGTSLWQSVGFGEEQAMLLNVLTGVANILTTFIAIASIDRFGRKPLLVIGSAAMAVCLGLMALAFSAAPLDAEGRPALAGALAVLALVGANGFVIAFGFSWGPVVWVLLGEMFPNRIRGAALALAACLQWVANYAISSTFPPMAEHFGLGASYAIYALFAALGLWFVLARIRETKGMPLEQMR
jgi:SP family sugar:H+ symporter-like MFS transporter